MAARCGVIWRWIAGAGRVVGRRLEFVSFSDFDSMADNDKSTSLLPLGLRSFVPTLSAKMIAFVTRSSLRDDPRS